MRENASKRFLLWLSIGLLWIFSCAILGPGLPEGKIAFFRQAFATDWKHGYVDRNGEWAIPPREFGSTRSFSGGVAKVSERQEDGTYKIGYINAQGEICNSAHFNQRSLLQEHQRLFRRTFAPATGAGRKNLDLSTRQANLSSSRSSPDSKAFKRDALPSSESHRTVARWDTSTGKGKFVLDVGDLVPYSFHEGVAIVSSGSYGDIRFGLIDREGNFLMEPILIYGCPDTEPFNPDFGCVPSDEEARFEDGRFLAAVGTPREGNPYNVPARWIGKWGYASRDGGWAIEPRFDLARSFSEGRAVVFMKDADDPKWWNRGILIGHGRQ